MIKENPPGAADARASGSRSVFDLLRELTTGALRYWEVRRVFYNALLAVIAPGRFAASWPASRASVTFDGVHGPDAFLLERHVRRVAARVRCGVTPAWT